MTVSIETQRRIAELRLKARSPEGRKAKVKDLRDGAVYVLNESRFA